jgi:DnaJ-class molecular chaperone
VLPLRYELLIDPGSREAYDAYGMAGVRQASEGMPPGLDDFFAQFFGDGGTPVFSFGFGGGGAPRRRGKGQDSVIAWDVTLADLYNGKIVMTNMEKEVLCGLCKGCVHRPRFTLHT